MAYVGYSSPRKWLIHTEGIMPREYVPRGSRFSGGRRGGPRVGAASPSLGRSGGRLCRRSLTWGPAVSVARRSGRFPLSVAIVVVVSVLLMRVPFPQPLHGASASISRHVPGSSPSTVTLPMAARISRSVGKPTFAVMRRTWRFFPSRMVSSTQLVGTFAR
jgi:hypothetical protein